MTIQQPGQRNNINVTQHQVYCELHKAFVEYWEAMFVDRNDIRKQRPAENNTQMAHEYSACVDCLAEEIHPLPLDDM